MRSCGADGDASVLICSSFSDAVVMLVAIDGGGIFATPFVFSGCFLQTGLSARLGVRRVLKTNQIQSWRARFPEEIKVLRKIAEFASHYDRIS